MIRVLEKSHGKKFLSYRACVLARLSKPDSKFGLGRLFLAGPSLLLLPLLACRGRLFPDSP